MTEFWLNNPFKWLNLHHSFFFFLVGKVISEKALPLLSWYNQICFLRTFAAHLVTWVLVAVHSHEAFYFHLESDSIRKTSSSESTEMNCLLSCVVLSVLCEMCGLFLHTHTAKPDQHTGSRLCVIKVGDLRRRCRLWCLDSLGHISTRQLQPIFLICKYMTS